MPCIAPSPCVCYCSLVLLSLSCLWCGCELVSHSTLYIRIHVELVGIAVTHEWVSHDLYRNSTPHSIYLVLPLHSPQNNSHCSPIAAHPTLLPFTPTALPSPRTSNLLCGVCLAYGTLPFGGSHTTAKMTVTSRFVGHTSRFVP